jgi:hypothetical protein
VQLNNGTVDGENFGDEKYYCWSHKKQMIKKYKKEIVEKQKEDAKKEKIKIKEEVKKQKEDIKQKMKEDKLKIKEDKLKMKEDKLKMKEDKQKTKEDKQKMKDDKQKMKEDKQIKVNINNKYFCEDENQIIGPIIINNFEQNDYYCIEILKSGIKKGFQCKNKKFTDNLCKKHFSILSNKLINI